ncbi:J domain-containing protein [Synechococcus sp. M16CYN]|uniref:J domain-containing protein n=1 Tax=Synechococcus sp. M16CYN TaxID=3103139 RepID=UPI003245CCF2
MPISHYQRLGVAPEVDSEALRQAFRRKSKTLHPDTTELPEAQASKAFQQLRESYTLLADPGRRDAYDAILRQSQKTQQAANELPRSNGWSSVGQRRPLSGGEWFSLMLLSVALLLSVLIGLGVAMIRGRDWQVLPSWLTDEQTLKTTNVQFDFNVVRPAAGELTPEPTLASRT